MAARPRELTAISRAVATEVERFGGKTATVRVVSLAALGGPGAPPELSVTEQRMDLVWEARALARGRSRRTVPRDRRRAERCGGARAAPSAGREPMLRPERVAHLCLTALALGAAVFVLAAIIAPEPAEAGDDCPDAPVVGPVIEGACDVAIEVGDAPDTALDAAGGALGDAAGAAGEGILDLIANAMLDGAGWLLGAISSLIDATTEVRITGITTACQQHAHESRRRHLPRQLL